MRNFFALLLVLSSSAAFGSFDLMYLPDAAFNRVHRFDPVNRVYLGSFSSTTARYISAHRNSPYVVAGSSTVNVAFDGSTGEFVNMANTFGTNGTMTSSGNLLAFSGTSSFREMDVPNFNTTVASGLSGIVEARGIAAVGSLRYVVGRDTASGLSVNCYSSSGTLQSSLSIASSAAIAPDAATASLGVTTSSAGVVQLWFTYRTNLGGVTLVRCNAVSSTVTLNDTFAIGGFSTATTSATQAVMGGHGNSVFVVGPDATTPTLTRIQQLGAFGSSTLILANNTTNTFSVPATGSWNGANIVAPEPSSMAAIGLGLAAITSRRKRAASS